MTSLSTRFEAATLEQLPGLLRELAHIAYPLIPGDPERNIVGSITSKAGGGSIFDFNALLDMTTPESFLAAAMMLVPEGWRIDFIHDPELPLYAAYMGKPISKGKGCCLAAALGAAIARSLGQ